MFEHFTDRARNAVVVAQIEAGELRHNWIGTEHLLLGIAALEDGAGRSLGHDVLRRLRLEHDAIRADVLRIIGAGSAHSFGVAEAEALRSIGIDLDEVRRWVEEAFGPGALDRPVRARRRRNDRCSRGPLSPHIPFTRRAKKVLELALREARVLRHTFIGTEHILLGMSREGEGVAAQILRSHGIDDARLRAAILQELGRPPAA